MNSRVSIGEELGRGGFCMVHDACALDANGDPTGPALAIKRIKDDLNEPPDVVAQIRERFEREARLLDDTLDHPHIISVTMRNLSGDDPYFVMPKAEGNLTKELPRRSGDEDWVVPTFRNVLEGMAYAHGQGVIHRDLKPDNILVLGGTVKLTDFGLGKNVDGGTVGLTKTFFGGGTEPYMAPEQFNALKKSGKPADVFALGKLLMEMLSGETPVVGVADVSELPERFRYFVSRCCEAKPENRFSDAQEALDVFMRVVEDDGYAETPEDTLDLLIEAWFATPEGDDLRVVQQIDELLRSNAHEEALFTREIPRLPKDMLGQYMDEIPDAFLEMLRIYDGHVSGGLPFDYCDTVADFYAEIYRRLDRLDVRQLVLRRLFDMGRAHNRWHVRDVVINLLQEFADPSTVAMAADVIRDMPSDAMWVGENYGQHSFAQPVAQAFGEVMPPEAPAKGGDAIPF